jgi:hypothetical protein
LKRRSTSHRIAYRKSKIYARNIMDLNDVHGAGAKTPGEEAGAQPCATLTATQMHLTMSL